MTSDDTATFLDSLTPAKQAGLPEFKANDLEMAGPPVKSFTSEEAAGAAPEAAATPDYAQSPVEQATGLPPVQSGALRYEGDTTPSMQLRPPYNDNSVEAFLDSKSNDYQTELRQRATGILDSVLDSNAKGHPIDLPKEFLDALIHESTQGTTAGSSAKSAAKGIWDALTDPEGVKKVGDLIIGAAKTGAGAVKEAFTRDESGNHVSNVDKAIASGATRGGLGLVTAIGDLAQSASSPFDTPQEREDHIKAAWRAKYNAATAVNDLNKAIGYDPATAPNTRATTEFVAGALPFAGGAGEAAAAGKFIPWASNALVDRVLPAAVGTAEGALPTLGKAAIMGTSLAAKKVGLGGPMAFVSNMAKGLVRVAKNAAPEANSVADAAVLAKDPAFNRMTKDLFTTEGGMNAYEPAKQRVEQELQRIKQSMDLQVKDAGDKIDMDKLGQKQPNGAFTVADDELNPQELKLRNMQRKFSTMQDRYDSLDKWSKVAQFGSDAAKLGVSSFLTSSAGAGVMGTLAASSALPEDIEQVAHEGAVTGLALSTPALIPEGMHTMLASKTGRMKAAGDSVALRGSSVTDPLSAELSDKAQRNVNIVNGTIMDGGKKVVAVTPETMSKITGQKNPVAGVVKDDVAYLRSDEVEKWGQSGVLGHELSHHIDDITKGTVTNAYKTVLDAVRSPEQTAHGLRMESKVQDFLYTYMDQLRKSDPTATAISPDVLMEEGAAELTKYVLSKTPLEEIYSGKSLAKIIGDKVGDAIDQLTNRQGQPIGRLPDFGAPFTRKQFRAVQDALYEYGRKVRRGDISPAKDVAPPAPEQPLGPAPAPEVDDARVKDVNSLIQKGKWEIPPEHVAAAIHAAGPNDAPADILIKALQMAKGEGKVEPTPEAPKLTPEQVKKQQSEDFWKGYSPDERPVHYQPQPNEDVSKSAADYMKLAGLPFTPHRTSIPVNEHKGMALADQYMRLPHDPNNPEVKKAYQSLIDETMAQAKNAEAHGYKFEAWDKEGQPYANSAEMLKDVKDNKHLYYFPTEGGYGEAGGAADHPMLQPVEFQGKTVPANDVFRAVHDLYGHAEAGWQFGPRGEYNAFLSHSKMFSKDAQPALAMETMGQNSFVNYGPHMRGPNGELLRKGDEGYLGPTERPYAEQKANILHAQADLGRTGSAGIWDSSFVSGEGQDARAALAEQVGADPSKHFYQQKPDVQKAIRQHYMASKEAQYQPSPAGELRWTSRHYDMTPDQLEQFLIFGRSVAGHASKDRAPMIERMLTDLLNEQGGTSPLAALQKLNQTEGGIAALVKKHGFGPYGQNIAFLKHLAESRIPDLKNITEEELQNIPNIGPKTAQFFKMHTDITKDNNVALDTHILSWLRDNGFGDAPKSTPPPGEVYNHWSDKFREAAKEVGVSPNELDLRIWLDRSGNLPKETYQQLESIGADRPQYMPEAAPQTEEFKKWSEGAPVMLNSGVQHLSPSEVMGMHVVEGDDGFWKIVDNTGKKMIGGMSMEQTAKQALALMASDKRPEATSKSQAGKFQTGKPVVVGAYHGSPSEEFHVFDPNALGSYTGAPSAKQGFFFSGNPETAKSYQGKQVYPYKGYAGMTSRQKDDFSIGIREAMHDHNREIMDKQLMIGWDNDVKPYDHTGRNYAVFRKENGRNVKVQGGMTEDQAVDLARESERVTLETNPIISNGREYAEKFPTFTKRLGKKITGQDFSMEAHQPTLHEVYVKFKNPFVKDFKGDHYREQTYNDLLKKAKADGHDGAIFTNTYDGGGNPDNVFVAFDNKNIKSTANMGTFDPNDPNIMFQPSTHPDAIKEPAWKMRDGKIFSAPVGYHSLIPIDREYRGSRGQQAGFVTNKGEFLNRDQAFDRALEMSQLTPKAKIDFQEMGGKPEDKFPLHAPDVEAEWQFQPNRDPEAINADNPAAIRTPDGKIYTGKWHPSAFANMTEAYTADQLGKWAKQYGEKNYFDDGFVNNKGEFLTRPEARAVVERFKQMTPQQLEKMDDMGRKLWPQKPRALEALRFRSAMKEQMKAPEPFGKQYRVTQVSGGGEKPYSVLHPEGGSMGMFATREEAQARADSLNAGGKFQPKIMTDNPEERLAKSPETLDSAYLQGAIERAKSTQMQVLKHPELVKGLQDHIDELQGILDKRGDTKHANFAMSGLDTRRSLKREGEQHYQPAPAEPFGTGVDLKKKPWGSKDQFDLASRLATQAHVGQKYGTKDFIEHPSHVASLVADELKPAAMLHDAVEDKKLTLQDLKDAGVHEHTVDTVDTLTRRPNETYSDYIDRVKVNPDARDIKMADLHSNLGTLPKGSTLKSRYVKAMNQLVASDDQIANAFDASGHPEKSDKIGAARDLPAGTPVSDRIDIPGYNATGDYPQALHLKNIGLVQGYDSIVTLDNPTAYVREKVAEKVKKGEIPKIPMSAINGDFNPSRTIPADIGEWAASGFNPKKHSYYYEKGTNRPIISGDKSISTNNTVFWKNPVYDVPENFLYQPRTTEEVEPYVKSYADKYPEALPVQFQKDKQGNVKFFKRGDKVEAAPTTYGYGLPDTPLAQEAAKGISDPDKQHEAVVKAYASKMLPEAKAALKVPEVAAAIGWYRELHGKIADKLKAVGALKDLPKFMELISASSPQTDPWQNFKYAVDAWNQWRRGTYDDMIKRYHEEYAKYQAGELRTAPTKAMPQGKVMESVGQFEDHLERLGIKPRGTDGKLFGKSSDKVMHALAGTFLDTAGKLKIHQFVGNLKQESLNATIDMWAARTLHRLGWQDSGTKQWRLLPFQEAGVDEASFKLGQDVFKQVADQMGLSTDDLQALMWFSEKKNWYDKGWSAKLDYGDFRHLVPHMKPVGSRGEFNYEPDIKAYRSATRGL